MVAHVRRAHPGAAADELSTMDMARCSLMSGCGAIFDRARLPAHEAATGVGCPSRSRHFLWRYAVLKRRIAEGEVTLLHVPDAEMPADVLTK